MCNRKVLTLFVFFPGLLSRIPGGFVIGVNEAAMGVNNNIPDHFWPGKIDLSTVGHQKSGYRNININERRSA